MPLCPCCGKPIDDEPDFPPPQVKIFSTEGTYDGKLISGLIDLVAGIDMLPEVEE